MDIPYICSLQVYYNEYKTFAVVGGDQRSFEATFKFGQHTKPCRETRCCSIFVLCLERDVNHPHSKWNQYPNVEECMVGYS